MPFLRTSYPLINCAFGLLATILCLMTWHHALASETSPANASQSARQNEPISPIPLTHDQASHIVELGKRLFHDPRLSSDNSISCANCHPLDKAGADGLKVSIGVNGAVGVTNAPTVLNSGFQEVLFWDGRAASLEEQISGPIHDPNEMASSWAQVTKKLRADKGYLKAFADVFPQGITPQTIARAIASFERTLITPNSRFDRYLRGETDAINEAEKQGYRLFKTYGCSSCHQGVIVGGNMYQKMGIFGNYFEDRDQIRKSDLGRYNVTGIEEHKHQFKVPSLRNIALTAPYFHDGSAGTLEEAVAIMAKYQLGRTLNNADLQRIVAFLKTLNGAFKP